jgi:hypothetical protein
MTKKLLIPSAICILAIALLVILLSPKKNDQTTSLDSSTETIPTKASTDSQNPKETDIRTKRNREDHEATLALRQMEKEFDKLLPAQFPEQFSSMCDVTLEPGESLVLGGFRKSDGNYEFTVITVTPNDFGEAVRNYSIKATTMVLSPERSSELGFDALVAPSKTRIQKSLVVSSEAITGAGDFVGVMTGPYAVAPTNTPTTISVGNSESAHVISTLVNPQNDGDSIRLRTRIESPDDSP